MAEQHLNPTTSPPPLHLYPALYEQLSTKPTFLPSAATSDDDSARSAAHPVVGVVVQATADKMAAIVLKNVV